MGQIRQIPIREFMTTNVTSLHITETLSDAYEKMNNHHIRHLPVIDDRKKVVGIFTSLDLNRAHSPRQTEEGWWYYDKDGLSRLTVRHFMTKEPVTLTPDNTLKEAAEIMALEKFGCIPIIDAKSELAGIITYIDVLKHVATLF